jgi:hypothetical protein
MSPRPLVCRNEIQVCNYRLLSPAFSGPCRSPFLLVLESPSNPSIRGATDSHLHAVLLVSISQSVDSVREAEMSPNVYEQLRRVSVRCHHRSRAPDQLRKGLYWAKVTGVIQHDRV